MDVKVYSSMLYGEIDVPPSKSFLHRAIIAAALSYGNSIIKNVVICDDILATIDAMITLGAKVEKVYINDVLCLKIEGVDFNKLNNNFIVNCNQSATTLRFLISIFAALGLSVDLICSEMLMKRPINHIIDALSQHEINCCINENKISVKGNLSLDDFYIVGDVSSQYISGLIMALPLLKSREANEIKIYLLSKLKSSKYVDITIDILSKFGIKINKENYGYRIPINQKYVSTSVDIEADYSLASNFLVADSISCKNVICKNLNNKSLQADKYIVDIIKIVNKESEEILVDAENCIDIVPALSVLFCYKKVKAIIYNVERLKIKESDRLKATYDFLNKMGANIHIQKNKLIINGSGNLKGGVHLDSYSDHRIAMAIAIAGAFCDFPIVISSAECVNKSYPDFWRDYSYINGCFR